MPFKKLGGGAYEGPSGKKFNLNQIRMYYARGGKFPGQEKHMAKGGLVEQPREGDGSDDNKQLYTKRPLPGVTVAKTAIQQAADFAKGGAVIQEKRSRFSKFGGADIESKPMMFMSQKDPFRTDSGRQDYEKTSPGGELSRTSGDKSETPVKPR